MPRKDIFFQDSNSGASRTTYSGPVLPVDTPKMDVRIKTCSSLQLTDALVAKYMSEQLYPEETEKNYNASIKIDFKVIRKLGLYPIVKY